MFISSAQRSRPEAIKVIFTGIGSVTGARTQTLRLERACRDTFARICWWVQGSRLGKRVPNLAIFPVNIFIDVRLRWMLHDATLRLPVKIITSIFAALALLALTFSQLRFLLILRKLDSLFAKPHQVVLSSSNS